MKLLVTGGLGFIGSNFIIKLLKENENFEIINVDAGFAGSNLHNVIEIQNSKKYDPNKKIGSYKNFKSNYWIKLIN